MGSTRQRKIKERLKELCAAHTQIEQDFERHRADNHTSQIVLEMYERKIREIERQITHHVRSWLGIETPQTVKTSQR